MPESQNIVTLKVNGKQYAGWTSVSISVALQSLARSFALSSTRTITGAGDLGAGIHCGDAVEVLIGGDLVCTGYVTDRTIGYDANNVKIDIKGASKTIDLSECSLPERAPKQFKHQTPADHVAAVCRYFGIGVVDQVAVTEKLAFDVKVAETVEQALVRFLKTNSLILGDDEAGNVVLTKVASGGNASDALELGVNVLSCSRAQSFKERFSRVVAIGQSSNALSENPVTNNQLTAAATDPGVTRERVKVIQVSGNATAAKLQRRAQLVLNAGQGKSDTSSYTVTGWRQSDGALWQVNQRVSVRDGYTEQTETLLITSLTFSLTDSGMRTSLECKPESALLSTDESDDSDSKSGSKTSKSGSTTKWSDLKKPASADGGNWTAS